MNIKFEKETYELNFIVKNEDSAAFLGSGDVGVLSTPAMINMMENTARIFTQEYLTGEWTTVGTQVCIKHLRPAPIGAKIRVVAKILEVDGKRLNFHVEAYWNDKLLGEGTHERYIVDKVKFLEKLKQQIS